MGMIGDYRTVREVGRGGMGQVFEAVSPRGVTVAVKTMLFPEAVDPRGRWEAVERFQRGARAARSLTHPNIVNVLDIGIDRDRFFIVMEFLDGQTLRDVIRLNGPVQPGRAIEIATAVCEALAYAHEQGVIHRDIKPENIMVLANEAVKVTDFGLATIAGEPMVSQEGAVVGTLAYIAPEQLRGEAVDARSDIFALGATFYEMLSGRRAFAGQAAAEVLNRILTEEPPEIPDLLPHLHETLVTCLRKQPELRFQSARDVLAALHPARASAAHLATAILPGRASGRPVGTSNLPLQLTRFVGRADDMQHVMGLLADPAVRLVTLTGPAGIGKTRLALQAASDCIAEYPDGVWLVELEQVQDMAAVPTAIATVLQIALRPGPNPAQQIAHALAGRQALLLCDTFEHVIGAAGFVGQLVRSARGLKCLVTSRVPLRIRGERVHEVAPLPQPPVDCPAEFLPQYDSIALFAERAREVSPSWQMTERNSPAVAELCRRLEGIPLCIELAAARVHGMTPEELLTGLQGRLQILASSANQDVPPRQRTLSGAIDWSYNLLDSDHQALLAQLSVFRGGFFRRTAEAVTRNSSTLELVLELHAHSLLMAKEVEGQTRYGMLEAVRAYSAERLRTTYPDQVAELLARHAAYFCDFAEARARQVRRPGEMPAIAEMSNEIDNCRAALEWACENDSLLCARLSCALHPFFVGLGLWDDALKWAERGLAASRDAGSSELEASQLLNLASASHDRRDLEKAAELARVSLDVWRRLGDRIGEARALNLSGVIAHETGDDAGAVELHRQALSIRREENDRVGEAISLHNLGLISQHQGNGELASEYYSQVLDVRRRIGDHHGVAETLCNLGALAQDSADYPAARSRYLECLDIWRAMEEPAGTAMALHNLGEVASAEGNAELAVVLVSAAARAFRRIGSPFAADSETFLASLKERLGTDRFADRVRESALMPWRTVFDMAAQA